MSADLPYSVEYAKSSRASCQNCKNSIQKDSLRLAVVVQSPVHDGTIPKWYHPHCFFIKQRPKSIADIANFDNIRWEDQKDIKEKIEESLKLPALPAGKGRKRASSANNTGPTKDYLVQYAKSNKSTCKACEEKIVQGEIRVSKKDFESEHGKRYGGIDRWHHLDCFVKVREEFEFYAGGDALPGIKDLSKDDQKKVKTVLPSIKSDGVPPVKKVKDEPEDTQEEEQMKQQNDELFKVRDMLSQINKKDLIVMLEKNEQQVPQGVSNLLDRLSDIICFGTLKPCPKCTGQLVYNSGLGYKCTGDMTEWTKCEYVTHDPKRKKCSIPSDLKQEYPDLKSLKPKVKKRLIKVTAPSTSSLVKKEDTVDSGPKVEAKPKPLKHMQFFFMGRTKKDRNALKKDILLLGGEVITKLNENVAAVISTQQEIDKMSDRMEEVKSLNIQVITEDFVEEAKEYTKPAVSLIKKKTISSWGGNLSDRINIVAEKSSAKSKGKSSFEKSGSGKMKLQLKGGGTVDPDSGLEDVAHVYQSGKDKYTVTLVLTDIQTKKNSYYKLQTLKHDKQNKYWLFRSWGRIGTTIGGTKLEQLSLEECIEQFESLYEEKTGNVWSQREYFVKVPQKMYPVDIDHGEEASTKLLDSDIKSDLEKPVQDLIRLIFDEVSMKKVMAEFEIDTEKMPLGKLSKKQIQKAYSVLTNLQDLLKNENTERVNLVDASNKFYNLIPHNFGISGPKVLENIDEIHLKCEMLDALLEMEIAYSLLHTQTDSSKNPLDAHYKQLNTDIKVLDKESEEYKNIEQYVKNTHAETHKQYDLEIEDVFVVKRQGEDSRYRPFKKLHNRKLLWHGTRTTNYAGIFSQGLRIAPPEAPVTGYMFGKGIYFADMVSKSANYCCTNSENPTGLLLLSEVALGNMYERYAADYIEKLPNGKHSTFGRGQTQPNPKQSHTTKDGVEIPYGPPVTVKLPKSSALLYNEYIVYDVAQVKLQYLLKTKFKYRT
ncbi:PREDICTED: poly [ADP-ribose] polymerase [Dufourea novaeangliae]|uniref:Poly [ADP-ribose] polymerase n=1 Tax=Dufourea novaeangliae TaxID=178035 RepID=A0A154P952_DUFNO|nr:PREDICTED: poly [ADP-ribose] polymerase [Dufourea novaeangliae]KZC08363.1 Poly [ADP-ribose] polymerase [Dufourea novaeangliae]